MTSNLISSLASNRIIHAAPTDCLRLRSAKAASVSEHVVDVSVPQLLKSANTHLGGPE